MLEIISQLIEIQRLDNLIADAEAKLAGQPEYVQKAQAELDKAQAAFDEFNVKYEKDLAAKTQVEKAYEEGKTLLEKAQKKLPDVKNNKEYEAVLKEMDTLKKNVYESELRLIELSEAVDKYKAENQSVIDKLEKMKEELTLTVSQKNEENSELINRLAEDKASRVDAVKVIKRPMLSKYERIRDARHNLAVVRVENETCTGCYIKVPPQLYVEVKKEKELLQCPNCQRFLYTLPEEETANAED
jgi:predicted  nucleic acid-binding Zn-ribbon protein